VPVGVRDQHVPVARLQEQVVRAEQPDDRRVPAAGGILQRRQVAGEHRDLGAVELDRDGVGRPPAPDVRGRGVEERGHVLRVGRPQQVQHAPDEVERPVRVRCLVGRALDDADLPRGEPRRAAQHRGRRVGLQLEPAVQRGQPERHLPHVRDAARPAPPQVRVRQLAGHPGGDSALVERLVDDLAHGPRHARQGVEGPQVRGAQRLRGVVDPLARVRVGVRPHRALHRWQVRPAVRVRGAPDRPGERERLVPRVRRDGHPAQRERPQRAVRAGVLHPEVEHGGVGDGAGWVDRAVELLHAQPVAADLGRGDDGVPHAAHRATAHRHRATAWAPPRAGRIR
jgi:hypothetical protein